MQNPFTHVKLGIALVLLCLIAGIALGVTFGISEDLFKNYIAEGIATNPQVHDDASASKIWRYAQRAHFHATGIAAFSIGLIVLVMLSNMASGMKKLSSTLIGLGGAYPIAWFNMYLLAPSIGRSAAHHDISTTILVYIGVGGLAAGILILILHLFAGRFSPE